MKSIEGKPMQGDLLVKPLIKGDEMTLLEIPAISRVSALRCMSTLMNLSPMSSKARSK